MSEMIDLGGRQFQLRPLKLGQLRSLLDALDAMSGKSGGALIDAAADVVTAGLGPAHPDITAAAVLDLEASLDELNAAVVAILQMAGLKPQEHAMGEPQPVANPGELTGTTPESRSAPSMALSPPAAAIPTA